MMISELYKKQHIRIFFTDKRFYSRIILIIFVDIGEQQSDISGPMHLLRNASGIKTRELERVEEE